MRDFMQDLALSESDLRRYWAKVTQPTARGCLEWLGHVGSDGYGSFHVWRSGENRKIRAHRAAYVTAYGAFDPALQIDHVCMVRHCVNPTHLRLVTNAENNQHRAGAYSNSRSGIRGVSWQASRNRWQAQLKVNGRTHHLGRFTTAEAAEAAVVEARLRMFTHSDPDLRAEMAR